MSYKMSWKNWIVTDKNNFIGHDRQIIKRPAHLSIILGLGKRPKSSGEAWRVLAVQRYEFFPDLPNLLLKIGAIPNFLLVFLSQIGKKCVPLPTDVVCLLHGCLSAFCDIETPSSRK